MCVVGSGPGALSSVGGDLCLDLHLEILPDVCISFMKGRQRELNCKYHLCRHIHVYIRSTSL